MRDDMESNIQFCEEVEKFPVLYDYNRSDYSNRCAQDKAWLTISKKNCATAQECKDRWKNIRGSYSKNRGKLKTKSGQTRKNVKEYYLAPHLHFLDSFIKSRKTKDDDTEDFDESTCSMTENTEDYDTDSMELSESIGTSVKSPCSSVDDDHNFIKPGSSTENDYRKRQKSSGATAIPPINDVNRKAFQYFENKEQLIEMRNSSINKETSEPPDPDMAFFQSLLPDMRLMNNAQKRQFKMGILNLADQILVSSPSSTYNNNSSNGSQAATELCCTFYSDT